jgi:ketosteroid isomerase-like protein
MTTQEVGDWLTRYVDAWRTYDPERIGALFSADAAYRYHPYDDPVRGRDAIVKSWLDNRDTPGMYDASYRPAAVDGDTAVAIGSSVYRAQDGTIDRIYDNVFVMRFEGDGLCREFTEWYMKRPSDRLSVTLPFAGTPGSLQ